MFDSLINNVGCCGYHGGYMVGRLDFMFDQDKLCCSLLHLPGFVFSGALLVPFRFPYTFPCAL